MYRISKKFKFEAAHQLHGLPEDHQCGRLHGHSYEAEVTFVGNSLSAEGWLFDFGDLHPIKTLFANNYDHRNLNDIIEQPTSENLAREIYRTVAHFLNEEYLVIPGDVYLEKVRVSETESTYAEYFGV